MGACASRSRADEVVLKPRLTACEEKVRTSDVCYHVNVQVQAGCNLSRKDY